MDIKATAERLVRCCESLNPFDIAQQLNIIILYEPLGTIRGYYSGDRRYKFIHINSELPDYLKKFVCAHELGHAVMHPKANTPFLRDNTLLSINKLEIEANKFAACLLLPDDTLRDYADYHYTVQQIASCTGLPDTLVEYRIKSFM